MQLRRSLVTATVAVTLAFSLSACGAVDRIRGFDYATDRVYTPGAGTNDRTGEVDILGAAVVSAIPGQGTLIVTFVTSDQADGTAEAATLEGVSGTIVTGEGEGAVTGEVTAEEFTPVEIPANGYVNLADADEPIVLTGDFEAGNFLDLTFTFAHGQSTTFEVPVVSNFTGDWAGLDVSPGAEDAVAPEDHLTPSDSSH
jgi:hypothetical protein